MKKILKKFLGRTKAPKEIVPFDGFQEHKNSILYVDRLEDDDLKFLNSLLDWKAFVVDEKGRRFGNFAWSGKRVSPQPIPDPRHSILQQHINLSDKKVLEIGCFEGIHTVSLCRLAREVVAIDARIENVVKTVVRSNLFGQKPTVFKCDVENWDVPMDWLSADVCHHIGVLYHLKDPVKHLQKLSSVISTALFLDTHIAKPSDELQSYVTENKSYSYKMYKEHGRKDVFSGMYDHAKWLLLEDIVTILKSVGFTSVEVLEERQERNGPRVLLFAKR